MPFHRRKKMKKRILLVLLAAALLAPLFPNAVFAAYPYPDDRVFGEGDTLDDALSNTQLHVSWHDDTLDWLTLGGTVRVQ
jgi:hypothetical protein